MRKTVVILGLILGASVASYLPAVDGDFQFDDHSLLSDRLVTDPFGGGVGPWLAPGRPVATFTFALNYLAVGLDTRGWHLTNIVVHLCVVLLAWAFVRVTLRRAGVDPVDGPALASAGMFALHPLQTEAVAYITQRAESLASGLYLAALLMLLLRDDETRPARRRWLLAAAVALHAVGLATKPILVTLPLAWLLHVTVLPGATDAAVPAALRVRRRLWVALPLLALSVATVIWTFAGLGPTSQAGLDLPGVAPLQYAATQFRVIPTYLRLLVWPAGQCVDWYFPVSGIGAAAIAGAALLAMLVVGSAIVAIRLREVKGDLAAAARTASFGLLFFVLVLVPTSSVVPLRDPLAEHRTYLAALGVILGAVAFAACGVQRIARGRAALVGAAVTAAIVLTLAIATAARSAVWASPVALWTDAARKAPQKARVHLDLGYALLQANRPADALESFRNARELTPDHTVSRDALLEVIVTTLMSVGRFDQARAEVERTLVMNPGDPAGLAALATIAFAQRNDDECQQAALAALASSPSSPSSPSSTVAASAHLSLGKMFLRRGEVARALESLRRAAATGAVNAAIYEVLGIAEERSGSPDAACAAFARAAALPGSPSSSMNARRSLTRLRCL